MCILVFVYVCMCVFPCVCISVDVTVFFHVLDCVCFSIYGMRDQGLGWKRVFRVQHSCPTSWFLRHFSFRIPVDF